MIAYKVRRVRDGKFAGGRGWGVCTHGPVGTTFASRKPAQRLKEKAEWMSTFGENSTFPKKRVERHEVVVFEMKES